MVRIPKNFSGKKFSEKYNLDAETDFIVNNGFLIVSTMPDLTESDISDCITNPDDSPVTFDDLMDAIALQEVNGNKTALKKIAEKYKKNKKNNKTSGTPI